PGAGLAVDLAVGLLALGEGSYDHCSVLESGSLVFGLLAHHGGEGLVEDGERLVDLLFADDQRAETLDHFAVGAAGLDYQAVVEGVAADGRSDLAIRAADAEHHSAALEEQRVRAVAADDALHAVGDALALGLHAVGERVVPPEVLDGRGGG